jgi:RND family efflux transporter MFP subunit
MGGISRQALDNSAQQLANAKAALDTLANQMQAGSTPAAVEAARAAALRAEHSVSAVEKQREDLVLRAPWTGVIAARQVEVGAMVQPGQKLLTIVDNSKIYVDCQLSEQDMAGLAVGLDVSIQIDSLGRSFPGKITYISPVNDSQNQSFTVRVALVSPDPAIRGGMYAKTTISTVLKPDTLVVPKDAVQQKNGKTYVYVVTPQNTVEERQVQIGLKGDTSSEILGGLAAGERVAVSNLSRLRPGLTVATRDVDTAGKPDQPKREG